MEYGNLSHIKYVKKSLPDKTMYHNGIEEVFRMCA